MARIFGVSPSAVTRWARTGVLQAVRTPGGHYRFRASDDAPGRPRDSRTSSSGWTDAMPIATRLPDLAHWKAQVKCQAGCPVATDAGRYVQLIADGRDEDAFLVARAPNPFASVCGRVCAAPCEDACRRGAIDAPISIRALKRFVTEKYGVESIRPATQDVLRDALVTEGNRYAGHLPVHPLSRATAGATRPRSPSSAPVRRASPRRTTWRSSVTRSRSSRPPRSRAE